MKYFICHLLLLLASTGWCQSPKYIYEGEEGQQINEKNVKLWPAKSLDEYVGRYHFGMSEGEWELVVMKVDDQLIMQTFGGSWGKTDEGQETWFRSVQTIDTVALKNMRFRAGHLQGFFAVYVEAGKKPESGIVLTSQDLEMQGKGDTAEYGGKYEAGFKNLFDGKYPQLSYKVMDDAWFKSKTKDELQLMRNEIFARYGLRFIKGGKMNAYFSKQDWYRPQLDNVTDLLNLIERRNIEKILRFEKS
jgi:hypothetical protein